MPRKRITLAEWIHEALNDADKKTIDGTVQPCSMLSLVHMVGLQEKEVHTIRFGAGGKTHVARDLAEHFQAKADGYAQDLIGVQNFCMLAFYGSELMPTARHPFMVNGQVSELDPGGNASLSTEGPSGGGLVQQSMRHAEALFQQTYRRQQVQDEFMLRLNQNLMFHNQKLMSENQDAFEIIKEVMMKNALNEDERAMKKLEYERRTGLINKAIAAAPAFLSAAIPGSVPQSMADTSILDMLAESLTEEQAMAIIPHLPVMVQGLLMQRFGDHIKKKQQEAAEKQALARVPANAAIELGDDLVGQGPNGGRN